MTLKNNRYKSLFEVWTGMYINNIRLKYIYYLETERKQTAMSTRAQPFYTYLHDKIVQCLQRTTIKYSTGVC